MLLPGRPEEESLLPGAQLPDDRAPGGGGHGSAEQDRGSREAAERAFEWTFNFNISEFYSTDDIGDMVRATGKVARYYSGD